ncbi:MAG TPA: hypothetical protein PKW95_04645 [bacterium]|nr:hypothetical protein [bacterium]
MKKMVAILLVLSVLFVALAIMELLPDPLQSQAESLAHKIFPAKDKLKDKMDKHTDTINQSVTQKE